MQVIAYLVSHDFFAQVSIEQTMEEANARDNFKTRYFEDSTEALLWLLEA